MTSDNNENQVPSELYKIANYDELRDAELDSRIIQFCKDHFIESVEGLYEYLMSETIVCAIREAIADAEIGLDYDGLLDQVKEKIPEEPRQQLDIPPDSCPTGWLGPEST
jgi:hypothetical protein